MKLLFLNFVVQSGVRTCRYHVKPQPGQGFHPVRVTPPTLKQGITMKSIVHDLTGTNLQGNIARHALICSVISGLLGDILFFKAVPGTNVFIWTIALLGCGALLRWRGGLELRFELVATSTIILFFSAGLAWRDSRVLRAIDAIGLMASLALLLWQTRGGAVARTSLMRSFRGFGDAVGSQIAGFVHLLSRDIEWARNRERNLANLPAVIRGLIVAIPLVLVFGSLFASADPVFQYFTDKLFHWDLEAILNHALLICFCTWTAGGPLRALAFEKPQPPHLDTQRIFSVGRIETNIVLAALNLLFATFVLVQIQYFFGGEARLLAMKMTYSDYARRGFFELVVVAALLLPLLLSIDAITEGPGSRRMIRCQSFGLILLLFVIMVSALKRMSIYTSVYGLTELRLYTTAFMLWLALTFVWFMLSVLRGHRERFLIGSFSSAIIAIAALHVINPDGLIARTNIRHAMAGAAFDARYATSLSADAVPLLVKAAGQLPAESAADLRNQLAARPTPDEGDWRSFNWGRHNASAALKQLHNAH
jgi:hypothetical protein